MARAHLIHQFAHRKIFAHRRDEELAAGIEVDQFLAILQINHPQTPDGPLVHGLVHDFLYIF
jgi:hypothetical protein